MEWKNLAGDPKHAETKAAHAKWIPAQWAEGAPAKSAYTFDPGTYSWINKATGARTEGAARDNR